VAQTKKKRSRKHRGTQAGTVDRAGRTGRPQTKQDAKAISRQRRLDRMNREPTWRSSLNRAAIAAAVFGVLVVVAFGRPIGAGVTLALFMLLLYIPMGYYTDLLIYRRRQRKQAAAGKSGTSRR